MIRRLKKMSEEEKLLREMKAVLQRVRSRMDEEFAPSGMTTAQLHMLHQVELAEQQGHEVSGADVARLCGVTPQTMQSALVRAERAGWLSRGTHPQNERLVLWEVTTSGRKIVRRAEQTFDEILRQAWGGISSAKMKGLHEVMDQMLANLAMK